MIVFFFWDHSDCVPHHQLIHEDKPNGHRWAVSSAREPADPPRAQERTLSIVIVVLSYPTFTAEVKINELQKWSCRSMILIEFPASWEPGTFRSDTSSEKKVKWRYTIFPPLKTFGLGNSLEPHLLAIKVIYTISYLALSLSVSGNTHMYLYCNRCDEVTIALQEVGTPTSWVVFLACVSGFSTHSFFYTINFIFLYSSGH